MNELTIVIVNYNSKPFLEVCLESIRRETTTPGVEVVVVDNASADRDFSVLMETYPEVRFLQNSENVGFAKACNRGLRHAKARFYLLLNPDTEVQNSAIDRTLGFLDANPDVGIAGCRVANPDGSIQRASRRAIPDIRTAAFHYLGLSRLFPRNSFLAGYNLTHLDENQSHPVEAVSGSFLLFRHEILQALGGLDEDFFLYGEDLDFCYRTLQLGWKVYYFHGATVIHHKRHSWGEHASPASYHFYDAMRIFYRKHYADQSGLITNFMVNFAIGALYWVHRLKRSLFGTPPGRRGD